MSGFPSILPSAASDPGAGERSGSGTGRGSAVVLVEDDAALLSALSFSLGIEGHEVFAYSSAEAMLADGLPSGAICLVVDQQLPGMSGLDLVETLRDAGLSQPAILITGRLNREARARAHAIGIRVVDKPLMGNALSEAINQLLS